jgi:hypothetical protein
MMVSENKGLESQVVVENEKQVITIGNSTASKSVSKSTITVEKEREIIDEIEKHCAYWRKIGNIYIAAIIFFGLAAVSTSVMVSIYTGSDPNIMEVATIKVMACISTISLGILTAFNLVTNSQNARSAWRSLNAALMLYAAGSITLQQLIEHYQKGENQMGSFSFSYGTNTDNSGTYAHDIIASSEERKQKQHEMESRNLKEGHGLKEGRAVDKPTFGVQMAGTAVDENLLLKD